jgi:hypothetical protein
MHEENVMYIHLDIYTTIKKNEIMLFAKKWTELEIIILHKISLSNKDKCHEFSHICEI